MSRNLPHESTNISRRNLWQFLRLMYLLHETIASRCISKIYLTLRHLNGLWKSPCATSPFFEVVRKYLEWKFVKSSWYSSVHHFVKLGDSAAERAHTKLPTHLKMDECVCVHIHFFASICCLKKKSYTYSNRAGHGIKTRKMNFASRIKYAYKKTKSRLKFLQIPQLCIQTGLSILAVAWCKIWLFVVSRSPDDVTDLLVCARSFAFWPKTVQCTFQTLKESLTESFILSF